MGELLEVARNVLDERGWSYSLIPEHDALQFLFRGDGEQWDCYIRADEESRNVVVYSVCPFTIPEERRAATTELLSRANYGLLTGNFEMDMDDGQIRFKTGIDVRGAELTEALVERLILPNMFAMTTYLPAITAMVDGGASPSEALAAVEG